MIDTKLNTLLRVAEYRSFTQAAKKLNLTQPAVSQHIHALEDELGAKLFERAGNRLVLTKAGEKAVSTAKALSALYSSLKDDLSDATGSVRELRIGITHTVESNRISAALAHYAADRRDLKIRLITDKQDILCRKLKNYELDMAIIDGSTADPGLKSTMLDTDRLVMVAAVDHPLAHKASVTLDELRHEKMILRLPGSGTGNMFLAALQSKNISINAFNVILEIDNIATIKDLVRRHYGVSVLAESACLSDIAGHKLVGLPIDQLNMKREINILVTPGFPYAEFLDDLIRIYRNGG